MREEQIAYALGQIDPKYILEAAPRPQASTRRFRWAAVAACLALVVVLAASAAVATGFLDSLRAYFQGDTEPYLEEILSAAGSVANEDVELRIEGAIADESTCHMIVSLIGLTQEGKGRISAQSLPGAFDVYALTGDGTRVEHLAWGAATYTKPSLFGNTSKSLFEDADATFIISYYLESGQMCSVKSVCLGYDGLELELAVAGFLSPEYTLQPEIADSSTLHSFRMSRIGLYFSVPASDCPADQLTFDVRLIYADGTVASQEEMRELGLSLSWSSPADNEDVEVTGHWGSAASIAILNLEDYCGVQVNGVNYYYSEE